MRFPQFVTSAARPWRVLSVLVLIGLVLAAHTAAFAQQASPATRPRPAGTAGAVPEAPTMDGEVLNDPAWKSAPIISGFFQEQPLEGAPATEKTEVRLVFTKDTLYIGAVMYDAEPGGIVTADPRRDASLDDIDSFRMMVDTYRDRQNGFVFGTNPAGVEYDGQVTNEGQGGGGIAFGGTSAAGSGGGFNINWDGAWTVRTKISEVGWTAEFAIPFRTLRFPGTPDQTWGVNFQRNIRRKNERAYWAPIPRQFNLYRVSLAGSVSGIKTPPVRNLKIMPYALGQTITSGVDPAPTDNSARVRRRPEVQRHAEPDARCHRQHRLRAGRGRRPAGQPRSLQPVLPGEAAVLPRERRLLLGRQPGRSRSVLQPAHRPVDRTARRCRSSPAAGCRARRGSSTSAC